MMLPAAPGRLAAIMVAIALPLAGGCSEQPAPTSQANLPDASDTMQQTLSSVRLALSEKNYGSAATQAKAAQSAFPNDPQVHLLAAQAEAHLGNAGNAATAFQRAIDAGLTEPSAALSNAAFNGVRNSEPFARLRSDLAPVRAAASTRPTAPTSSDRIRAGDVEIITDETGDYVRAGDVVLDTRQ